MKSKRRIVLLACLAGVLCIGVVLFLFFNFSHRAPLTPSEIDELAAALDIEIPRNKLWAVHAHLNGGKWGDLTVRFDCSAETAEEVINSTWMCERRVDLPHYDYFTIFLDPPRPWWDIDKKNPGDQLFKNEELHITALVRTGDAKTVMYFQRTTQQKPLLSPSVLKVMESYGSSGFYFREGPWYEREWRKDQ